MSRQTFTYRTRLEAPADEVFRWHERPGAFARLTPPWAAVEQLEHTGGIRDGARRVLRVKLGPLRRRWVLEHTDYQEGRQFADVQTEGPFQSWKHTHRMIPEGPEACYLEDHVEYELPGGLVGQMLGQMFVEEQLRRLFEYRHQVTAHDLAAQPRSARKLHRVIVAGSHGLVGSALVPWLEMAGTDVVRLVRDSAQAGPQATHWDVAAGRLDPAALAGADAVLNLAGASLAATRWSEAQKALLRDSRVRSTQLLADALVALAPADRPRVWVNASAVGYYGDRGEEILDEHSASGEGFLAELCRAWEAATHPAADAGVRVVRARFGLVLSPHGGVLQKMLVPFRLGAGGPLGSGQQYWAWMTLDDAVAALDHLLTQEEIDGPVNVVAPHLVTNADFTDTLARVLARSVRWNVPEAGLRLALGEMADEMLLASTRVKPARLLASDYRFQHPKLEGALRHLLTHTKAA